MTEGSYTPAGADLRKCRRCLLAEMSAADAANIEKYKEKILPEDRVSGEKYKSRLNFCKECDYLNAGTCNACGCYVELRAYGKNGHCPKKKW